MLEQRIIYPTENSGVAVIIPAQDCPFTMEELAQKDVPEGIPYKIVNILEVPSDRTFREAWEYIE